MEPEVKIEAIGKPKLGPLWYVLAVMFAGLAVYSALEPNQFLGTIGWLVCLILWYLVGTIGAKLMIAQQGLEMIGAEIRNVLKEAIAAQAEHLAAAQQEKGESKKEDTVH